MAEAWRECTSKCRSKNHASWLLSAITKSTSEIENLLCLSKCCNAGLIIDKYGRNVLHIAAACGKRKLISWVCAHCRVNINAKDYCSGWTPLHFAIHHCQIDAAIALLAAGADLYIKDNNAQTSLDLLRRDIDSFVINSNDEADVFTWGANASYTIGQPSGQSRSVPDCLSLWSCEDLNERRLLSVRDVVMTKYTSVFLTSDGRVFVCGSGRGGRLGLGSEETVLIPAPISRLSSKHIVSVSASFGHTGFITNEGQLFVTGSNEHHQLGLGANCISELSPKLVRFRKDVKLRFVACGRFHTAAMSDRELFTCGLNAGQLGLLKDAPHQSDFKLVSAINIAAKHSNGGFLDLLACSDGATVVKTCFGDVYALTQYGVRKITGNCPSIVQISVNGGHLDSTVAPDVLRAAKASDLNVFMLLEKSGQVLVWRENETGQGGILRELKCPGLGYDLFATWVWLPPSSSDGRILLCSKEGNAYIATLTQQSQVVREKNKPSKSEWSAFRVADRGHGHFRVASFEIARSTTRIKHIHRASSIVADPSLANFACVQARPEVGIAELPVIESNSLAGDMAKLFETSCSPYDSSTDVELVFGSNNSLFSHRVVLASTSSYFRRLFLSETTPGCINPVSGRLRINIADCEEIEFRPLLQFAYSGKIDLKQYLVPEDLSNKKSSPSPREIKKSPPSSGKGRKKNSPKTQNVNGNDIRISEAVVVNAAMLGRLAQLSRRFGFGGHTLSSELDQLKRLVDSGRPFSPTLNSNAKMSFERETLDGLADLWLRSSDGREFAAHRCVLSSRSDYFASMLAVGRWAEAGRAVITQPVESDVLELALNYIYTDWIGNVSDYKLLCKLVIYADQVFLNGLKSIAEVQLSMSPRLNLLNCAQLIDFASAYRAEILLPAATRYAIGNMTSLVESLFSSLLLIEDEALDDFASTYNRQICPAIRNFGPWYSQSPSEEEIEKITLEASTLNLLDDDFDTVAQRVSEMLTQTKEIPNTPASGGNSANNSLISRVATGRNRRQRRRSNNSESSDGGDSSGGGSVPLLLPSSSPIGVQGYQKPSSGITQSVKVQKRSNNNGWSSNDSSTILGTSAGSGDISLAEIMADEKRQFDSEQRSNNRPKTSWTRPIQIPSLNLHQLSSSFLASSPPNALQIVATSPSSIRSSPLSPSAPAVRGWGTVPILSPSAHSPSVPVMADILKQEQQRTNATRRQDRRSLHQIQLEERAIEELIKLYADLEVHGVAITVERMSVDVAAPTWVTRAAPNLPTATGNHFPALPSVR